MVTTVQCCPQNFELSDKICCFAVEISWAAEFRFSCGNCPVSGNSLKTDISIYSLVPAMHINAMNMQKR